MQWTLWYNNQHFTLLCGKFYSSLLACLQASSPSHVSVEKTVAYARKWVCWRKESSQLPSFCDQVQQHNLLLLLRTCARRFFGQHKFAPPAKSMENGVSTKSRYLFRYRLGTPFLCTWFLLLLTLLDPLNWPYVLQTVINLKTTFTNGDYRSWSF